MQENIKHIVETIPINGVEFIHKYQVFRRSSELITTPHNNSIDNIKLEYQAYLNIPEFHPRALSSAKRLERSSSSTFSLFFTDTAWAAG